MKCETCGKPENPWIRPSDRMPEQWELVLLCNRADGTAVGMREGRAWRYGPMLKNYWGWDVVSFWMLIPERPVEAQQGAMG